MVIGLGWLLARSRFLSVNALQDLNRLTYWVGLPSQLFYGIAAASPEIEAVTGLLIVGLGATVLAVFAAMIVGAVLSLPGASRGAFAQGVFRGNLAFIGLPVVLYAFSGSGAGSASAEASALLVFGPMVVFYNILAVLVLIGSSNEGRHGVVKGALYGLVTNPILLSCAAGLAVSLTAVSLPTVVARTLAAIGQMALPLALICIGGTLYTARIRGSFVWATIGAAMKVSLVPAFGLLLAQWVELSPEHTRIALILLACPTASVSYVLVRQLNGDEGLASSIVVISNFLAVPAMVVVLAVTA